jgi:YgiT-type zinc finger domain-containing protein
MRLRICPLCGSARLKRCVEDYVTRRGRRKVVVRALEIYRCLRCSEGFLTDEAMQRIERSGARRHAA